MNLVSKLYKDNPDKLQYISNKSVKEGGPFIAIELKTLLNEEEKEEQNEEYKNPDGGSKKVEELGLYGDEIDNIMQPHFKNYLPVITIDKVDERLNNIAKAGKKTFQFILNTISSKSKQPSGHYVAINVTPDSFEFYDPLAEWQPSDELKEKFRKLFEKLGINHYLKYKINTVKQQSDRTANCGFFAMKFLTE